MLSVRNGSRFRFGIVPDFNEQFKKVKRVGTKSTVCKLVREMKGKKELTCYSSTNNIEIGAHYRGMGSFYHN